MSPVGVAELPRSRDRGHDGRVGVVRAAAVAAFVVGLAGCDGSDPQATAPTRTSATRTTATEPTNAEPKGRLSPPEYRSIRAAYTRLASLENTHDVGKTLRVRTRACAKVTTQTGVLAALHADCFQTMRFYGKAAQLTTRKAECTRAAQAGDISCFAELFRSLGRSARLAAVRGAQTNAALRERRIRGQCARAIGTKKTSLAATRAVVRDGIGAAHALEARNEDSFRRAFSSLQVHLERTDGGGWARKALRQLR